MAGPYSVMTDFDGTVTFEDVAYQIIVRFSTGDWKALEEKYQSGILSSRDELAMQFSHVDASMEEILKFVKENAVFDTTFSVFIDYCLRHDIDITVVSEGLTFYIDLLISQYLSIYSEKIEVLANRAVFTNSGIKIEPLSTDEDCEKCGNCKLSYLEELRKKGRKIIYIGDGSSDFCASKQADIIFAKRKLADHLDEKGINYFKYQNFDDITMILEEIL